MKNPFLKRLIRGDKRDFFHTSTYGRAQNDKKIGVASTESFRQRLEIEKSRKIVGRYNSSQIANSGVVNGQKAKKYVSSEDLGSGQPAVTETPKAPKVPNVPRASNIPRKRV